MKRYGFSLFLLSILLLCVGCGDNKKSSTVAPTATVTPTPSPTATATPTPIPEEPDYELYISEVMANNNKFYLNSDCDWIEIGSAEDTLVNLKEYYLTDDLEKPEALSLDGFTIESDGFLVVTLDEEAPFHLNEEGETIYITRKGHVINEMSYTEEIGEASASVEGILPFATPGFPNTSEGYDEYIKSLKLPDVMFSEVMVSNSKYAGVDGQFYDVIELHNSTKTAINLKGLYLSDKQKQLDKYALPAKTLTAGEYLVIYCSGLDQEYHTPFKLSAGETVYLSDGETVLDMVKIPKDLEKNKSYGRYEKCFVYMEEPTIGTENKPGNSTRVQTPMPNVEPGLYAEGITVELKGEGTIYYTLDGTHPTEQSLVYKDPINIDKVTTIRTFAKQDNRFSELGAYTYLVGIEHTLPVVYVSLPNEEVSRITTNYQQTIESESLLTLYEDGEMKFSVPCGFRLHGNGSRAEAKQNFQLRFRSKYGMGRLKYRLFEDLEIDSFDSLLLKGGSEDYPYAMLRDEFCTGLCDGTTNLQVLKCKPCVLYLGDKYWGIYYLRERFSDEFVADHYNVSKESVDLLFSYGGVQNGSSKDYNALVNFVGRNDMRNEENYQKAMEQLDPISLMDWYICRSYMGDKDVANIRYFRSTEYDSKWRWMYFDLDWAFYHTKDSPISGLITNNGHNVLMYNLLKNDQFKDMFLKRYSELMDTILNEQYISNALDEFVAVIEPEMPKDRERWHMSMKSWNGAINQMHNYVKDGARTANVLRDIKAYFNMTDEQMKEYFGDKWK